MKSSRSFIPGKQDFHLPSVFLQNLLNFSNCKCRFFLWLHLKLKVWIESSTVENWKIWVELVNLFMESHSFVQGGYVSLCKANLSDISALIFTGTHFSGFCIQLESQENFYVTMQHSLMSKNTTYLAYLYQTNSILLSAITTSLSSWCFFTFHVSLVFLQNCYTS